LVRLIDDAFSGLNVAVLITARTFTDESPVYHYQAVGISAFDLGAPAHLQVLTKGKNDSRGAEGPAGEDAYLLQLISEGGTTFRTTSAFSTTMRARVFKGGVEITDEFSDADFRWSRTSSDTHSDAIWNSEHYSVGGKTLSITQDDVAGRTNFFCTLLRRI
jgi:hypothetical protein